VDLMRVESYFAFQLNGIRADESEPEAMKQAYMPIRILATNNAQT